MSFPRAIATCRPLLPLLFSTTLIKPLIKTSRPFRPMRPFTAFASLPASQEPGESSAPAFPHPKKTVERWRPMCLYYTQGKCTMMEDPTHMEKFNPDCSRDLQVKTSMLDHIRSQHLDYFLVLDLEGKIEILEFPVLIIDAKTMNVVDFFHRFVRPTEMNEKRINEYIEGKYGKFGVDCVWHDTSIPFKDVLEQFEEWLTQRQLWREEVGGCLNQAAFVTCGNWDLKTKVPEQCKVAKVKLPSYFMEWINLKDVHLNFYKRRMSDTTQRPEFDILDVQGKEYKKWVSDVENTFIGKGYTTTIDPPEEENLRATLELKAQALMFLRRHIHPTLKKQYLRKTDPKDL